MKSDENHVFIKFYQSSIFIFKALNFLMSLLKTNKLIELDRIGLALIFLKHFFQFINPFKTKTNNLNIFQCFLCTQQNSKATFHCQTCIGLY